MPAWPVVPAEYNIDTDADADTNTSETVIPIIQVGASRIRIKIISLGTRTTLGSDETRIDIHNAYR